MCILPAGMSQSMQGLFSLMLSFESITEPAEQKQLLKHSLHLLELNRASRVRLLCHKDALLLNSWGCCGTMPLRQRRMTTCSCCRGPSKTWYCPPYAAPRDVPTLFCRKLQDNLHAILWCESSSHHPCLLLHTCINSSQHQAWSPDDSMMRS